tara:strand:+ start:691 stop:1002 length:312 start_codon:yes stop_codon:yes gene_type:complete
MDSMKFPIRFDQTNGGCVKLRHRSDDYYRQLLTIAARTEPASQPLTPSFGVMDPTFKSVERGQFLFSAARFVPEVDITSIETRLEEADGTMIVNFGFRQRSED